MNTRKLTHTTMTMVAALGTTAIQPKQEYAQQIVVTAFYGHFSFTVTKTGLDGFFVSGVCVSLNRFG